MKKILIQILLLTSVLLMTLLLSSCNNIDTTDADDYESFLQKLEEEGGGPNIEFLPQVSNDTIQDIYLYYADVFPDSFYAIYLNCSYTEEQYEAEIQRINEVTEPWSDMLVVNSESFSYDSLTVGDVIDFNDFGHGLMRYTYFLFDSENKNIIYVTIFEKELNGKSTNIPSEYLPKELNELRSK